MANNHKTNPHSFHIFGPNISPKVKMRKIVFFILFCGIIGIQACYWLFANSVEPIIFGMPFGMFFVTMFIVIEFFILLILFTIEKNEMKD